MTGVLPVRPAAPPSSSSRPQAAPIASPAQGVLRQRVQDVHVERPDQIDDLQALLRSLWFDLVSQIGDVVRQVQRTQLAEVG
jgi:hypothetical protein